VPVSPNCEKVTEMVASCVPRLNRYCGVKDSFTSSKSFAPFFWARSTR
jgi:hypothetical protein